MKRKVALFLVGILISSYAPHTVLAKEYALNSTLRAGTQKVMAGLSRSPIPVQPKTLFVEPGANTENSGTVTGNNDIEAWLNGGYFEVEIPNDPQVTYPMRITLELNNAEWYFRNDLGIKVIKDGEIKDNVYTPANGDYKLELSRTSLNTATLIVDNKAANKYGNLLLGSSKEDVIKNINNILDQVKKDNTDLSNLLNNLSIEDNNNANTELSDLKSIINSIKNNVNTINSTDTVESIKTKVNTLESNLTNLKNKDITNLKNYLNKDKNTLDKINKLITDITKQENINNLTSYLDTLNSINDTQKPTEPKVLRIPLVVRTLTENADSTVRLLSSSSLPVDTDKKVFAIGTQAGLTTTVVRKPVTSRTSFEIEAIGIKENRINALKPQGAFELVAPSGYEFRMKDAKVTTEGGISGIDGNFTINHKSIGSSKDVNSKDYSTLQVVYSGLKQSTDITGAIAITGLTLLDINNETVKEQDLYINIRNITGDFIVNQKPINVSGNTVTPQNVLVGYVRDWKVALTPIGVVPTLVNGRLEGKERQNVNDQDHKAVTVRFEEQVKDAWWSQRVTKLVLPREVKVRKAVFERIRNINEEDLNGTYYNDRSVGTGRVRVDDNVITLSGITSKGEKASFDINLWLSIEPGFTGNVDLKVNGSGIADADRNSEDKGVVIAKVVNPIELTADLTDAKIGYQYFTVGNFSITETAAGRLKANEDVYISVVDNSADSMQIDSGFKWEVTQGDIRVKNMNTKTQTQLGNLVNNKTNGAHISFTVDKQSTVPSKITFKDVQVRLNNSYNISSANKFDLVAWGPAIANNYIGLIDNKNNNILNNINTNDYFIKPGISVPYIQSTGIESNNSLKNVVKLTVGNPIILVNNREVAMPTAAYISQSSNSTMVPVRFIATGLGIDESKIIWDAETGTITIDAGNRIVQMKTNSDIVTINGVEIPMLSPDGLRVKVEVRDNRAFIPFRTLGEAFGITVGWDSTTGTATYNDNSDMLRNHSLNSYGSTNNYNNLNDYRLNNKIGDITQKAISLLDDENDIY